MARKIGFWILAAVITVGASIYQRMTGPTHAKVLKTEIDGTGYAFRLPRSGGESDCEVVLKNVPPQMSASLFWKRYPSDDAFTETVMTRGDGTLSAFLPVQPPAGKLAYYLTISQTEESQGMVSHATYIYFQDQPLIIRFKGDVPAWLLILHILLMFLSMLLGAYALLCALAGMPQYRKYVALAFWIILAGGFVLGPLVQYHAFGVYWSGFPMGGDLTDNKTLLAMLALLFAVATRKFRWNRWATVAAVLVMFAVFSIPHSLNGSELDHATGRVITSDR